MPPQVAAQLLDEECDLTGLDVANASLIDEATSTAEAIHRACRSVPATDDGSPSAVLSFIWSPDLHQQTLIVVQTRADGLGVRILEADPAAVTGLGPGISSCSVLLLLQCHDTCGRVDAVSSSAHAAGALVVVATDLPISLPARFADAVVVGSAKQRF